MAGFPLAAGTYTINIDENGNGSYTINGVTTALTFTVGQDPGPGGLANVLIYSGLPGGLGVAGDLGLTESTFTLDVIRWNGNGTIAFYSDNLDGVDALADTVGPPTSSYTNLLNTAEIGPEGNNGATYTPLAGNPGYGNVDNTFIYNIVSDSVPEPGTAALMTLAVAGMFGLGLQRRRNQQ